MPEHVHLLVFPCHKEARIERLLFAIKRPYSYRIKRHLPEARSPLLKRLIVNQRPGVTSFRYWQKGPGYDRNLMSMFAVQSAIDHIHLTPVRRGLCQRAIDWPWSSARWYISDTRECDVRLPMLTRLPGEFFDGQTPSKY